eukprot:TRINITY_DN18930_c0_g2_i1.p5 TRINITY_DN18930_c0_g2~~TRINITY_DN18930_c0_g2_i1.p5  ORF type:complete len:105 (+),score=13.74 TRINITY_DN18930_c0_g2_i1:178-492(+)
MGCDTRIYSKKHGTAGGAEADDQGKPGQSNIKHHTKGEDVVTSACKRTHATQRRDTGRRRDIEQRRDRNLCEGDTLTFAKKRKRPLQRRDIKHRRDINPSKGDI